MENNKNKRGLVRAAPPAQPRSPAHCSSSRAPVPPSFLPSFLPGRYFKAGCYSASSPPAHSFACRSRSEVVSQPLPPAFAPHLAVGGSLTPPGAGTFQTSLASPLLETLLPPGEEPLSVGALGFCF